MFCSVGVCGVDDHPDIDCLCAGSPGGVADDADVGTGVLVFFDCLLQLGSADGTYFLFSVSAVGTVVLFIVGGACSGGDGDGLRPPDGPGTDSQGGVAIDSAAIVFIPSTSNGATSFCLPSGTVTALCL